MENPIYNRRSVRKYLDKNVSKEMIEQIIDADNRFTEICDTLSIGASIENMLLKATDMGPGYFMDCKYLLCIQRTNYIP